MHPLKIWREGNLRDETFVPDPFKVCDYDVIVVGAGHAGIEAAAAAARLGCETALFTLSLDDVANLPCNPSIGGTAKGQLVREIDALGGVMGILSDRATIQYRMLNRSKGPAVHSPRAQVDRKRYQTDAKAYLEKMEHLTLHQEEVVDLITEPYEEGTYRHRVTGVMTRIGAIYGANRIVLCTGTYLDGKIHIGQASWEAGPDQQYPARYLSAALKRLDLPLRRFKTGTPVRVAASTVRLEALELQPGDRPIRRFSFLHDELDEATREALELPADDDQIPCYIGWTNDAVHTLILDNVDRSPIFSGEIEGVGPRYCPSIEDKVVRFADKARHQLFLEPMGVRTDELYVQGLSSSMPWDVQQKMVHAVSGMEQADITRPAYAIEYTCLDPTALDRSLELKAVCGLYGAGQINGSSGYEEAAGQGLMAGLNAARAVQGLPPVMLRRDQAYIGVLIDDLVTKGTQEPYRMMTARAEYRLILRQDNADLRLTGIGREWGLVDDARYARYQAKKDAVEREMARLAAQTVPANAESAAVLEAAGSSALKEATKLQDLLQRPQMTYANLAPLDPDRPALPETVTEQVEIMLKYRGYIKLEEARMAKFRKQEAMVLPPDVPYREIKGLRIEAAQKLDRFRPHSVGQAARISGVSPADIAVLMVYLETVKRKESRHGDNDDGC